MNRVELGGAIVSDPQRRTTPVGTPIASFRLRVEADPEIPAVAACEIPVVFIGRDALGALARGDQVVVEGALTERRWTRNGVTQRRYEVVAASVRTYASGL